MPLRRSVFQTFAGMNRQTAVRGMGVIAVFTLLQTKGKKHTILAVGAAGWNSKVHPRPFGYKYCLEPRTKCAGEAYESLWKLCS